MFGNRIAETSSCTPVVQSTLRKGGTAHAPAGSGAFGVSSPTDGPLGFQIWLESPKGSGRATTALLQICRYFVVVGGIFDKKDAVPSCQQQGGMLQGM